MELEFAVYLSSDQVYLFKFCGVLSISNGEIKIGWWYKNVKFHNPVFKFTFSKFQDVLYLSKDKI